MFPAALHIAMSLETNYRCVAATCSGGYTGTSAISGASYATCDTQVTGQTCEPVCALNYDTEGEADGFTLNCDVATGEYGGSDSGNLECFRTSLVWVTSFPRSRAFIN